MSEVKLTPAQYRVLGRLAAGDAIEYDSTESYRYKYRNGQFVSAGTMNALKERGLVVWEGDYVITDAGRAAIAQETGGKE